uniref:Reverse transcriptase domain-containing protein n=1 Tax=Amphimedon queenslandica TaxID=400682 RepID=A0A1X7UVX8_AMPQE
MDTLLQGIPGVCVYLDDILISGQSEEEHLARLSEVLRRLAESGMRLKKEKCSFLLPSVKYLGQVISSKGLSTSDTKVATITNAPLPTNVSELRSFLRMVNYYGKFLPDLAMVLSPLYSLLQKNKG